jgi:predicted N-acetyltransferase YhbS
MITYTESLEKITPDHLCGGFFAGWPHPPSPADHLRLLRGSSAVILACTESGQVVGYITAISDGVSCAYLPHLEVLPEYQGQGIGSELVRRMLERLDRLYMIDLVCDESLIPFYERFGLQPMRGMALRHYDRQDCSSRPV